MDKKLPATVSPTESDKKKACSDEDGESKLTVYEFSGADTESA